jgi:hypothetical protein
MFTPLTSPLPTGERKGVREKFQLCFGYLSKIIYTEIRGDVKGYCKKKAQPFFGHAFF